MTDKTLFVKVGGDHYWTEDEINNLTEEIDEVVGDEVSVIATTDDVEYLSSEQVKQLGENIIEAVENDD